MKKIKPVSISNVDELCVAFQEAKTALTEKEANVETVEAVPTMPVTQETEQAEK